MFDFYSPNPVVVGIDGSLAAVRAAQWAVDEVAGSDIPLRLLYIREPNRTASARENQQALATAEEAVYDACSAINAMGKPVKVEMDVLEGHPVPELIHASDSTGLLCVGATGSARPSGAGFGSTAAELARSAHCSVAIIRGENSVSVTEGRSIVARIDGSPADDDVLQLAFQEAQRREAPLVLVTAWRSGFDDLQSDRVIADHDRRAHALLDHYMADWMPRYPEVEVRTVVAYGMFLNYLAEHAKTIQLVVVGAAHTDEVQQLVGPAGPLALRRSNFPVLVVR
jgi:nucleotide-binding universal stress UspA family protein